MQSDHIYPQADCPQLFGTHKTRALHEMLDKSRLNRGSLSEDLPDAYGADISILSRCQLLVPD